MKARVLLAAMVLGLATVAGACSSSHPASSSASTSVTGSSVKLAPAAFAQRIAEPGVVTINVHTPNAGNLPGTDLAIPYDQIRTSTQLPTDKTTPLAVYCRSGNMSAKAVADLAALGYTDIAELDGGYDAWLATGSTLQPAA